MARKFKSGATRRSFKGIGAGLQRGETRLKEQAQIQQQAMQLEKERAKEVANLHIAGLSSKARFEQGVLTEKQKLENSIRQHKLQAEQKRADTDVARLEGIAAEKKKYADHLKDLAPKQAKAFGDMAKGLTALGQEWRATQLFNKLDDAGVFEKHGVELEKALTGLLNDAGIDIDKLKTWEEKLAVYSKTFGSSFERLNAKIYKRVTENWKGEIAFGQDVLSKQGAQETKTTADEWWKFYGVERLKQLGIKPTSKYGRMLLGKFKAQGVLRNNEIRLSQKKHDTDNLVLTSAEDLVALNIASRTIIIPNKLSQFNSQLNAAVSTISEGAFEARSGQVTETPIGKGAAFEILGTTVVEKHTGNFRTEEDVRNFFKNLKTSEGEQWDVKHAARVERIVEKWKAASKEKGNEAKNLQVQRGTAFRTDYDKDKVTFQGMKTEERQEKYGYTTLKEFNQAWGTKLTTADIDSGNRDAILFDLGYNENARKHYDLILPLEKLLYDQNDELTDIEAQAKVFELLNDNDLYTKDEQKDIWAHLEPFKDLGRANTTPLRLVGEIEQIILGDQNQRGTGINATSLSAGSKTKAVEISNDIIGIYKNLLTEDKYKDKPVAAMAKAKELFFVEFARGFNASKPSEYGEGKYARKSGRYKNEFGQNVKGMSFKSNPDTDLENLFITGEFEANPLDTKGETPTGLTKFDYYSATINPYKPGTITNLGVGHKSLEAWITDHRAIPPQFRADLNRVAVNLANKNTIKGFRSEETKKDITINYPYTIMELSRMFNKPPHVIANEVQKHTAKLLGEEPVLFMDDGNSAAFLRNGQYVSEPNVFASTIDKAIKNQNVIPMHQLVRLASEGQLPPKEALIQYLEMAGYGSIHGDKVNVNGLIQASGLDLLSYEDFDKNFGLNRILKIKYPGDK
mgnify:CR=1 FL=1